MVKKHFSTNKASPLGRTTNIDGIPHSLITATHDAVQAHGLAKNFNGTVLRGTIDKKDVYFVWRPKGR